jgi:hypothetical protein
LPLSSPEGDPSTYRSWPIVLNVRGAPQKTKRRSSHRNRRPLHPGLPPDLPAFSSRSVQGHLSLRNTYTRYLRLQQTQRQPEPMLRPMVPRQEGIGDGLPSARRVHPSRRAESIALPLPFPRRAEARACAGLRALRTCGDLPLGIR